MIGKTLGQYEITGKLGEGGMGEVYRATDTRLGREVAIKVLPAAFSQDRERLARFEREARVLAQLQHANIASIYGLEESSGTPALVMELVEGPTLADRLRGGALPLAEVVPIARQLAEALEDAHEKGIVHRDLKPQNIKASVDGRVKVLDFGLARALGSMVGRPAGATDTTLPGTELGMVVGTAAYMAPEQARGLPVDKRADIWAFGVVLYEMLAGKSLFAAGSTVDTLAAVLGRDIDWAALPALPERVLNILRRCLERDPKSRLRDIGEARLAFEGGLSGAIGAAPGSSAGVAARVRTSRLAWLSATASLLLAAAFAALWTGARHGAPVRPVHAALLPPNADAALNSDFALSPDGQRLVFGIDDVVTGDSALWLRDLADGSLRKLPLASAQQPFWSPDGRQLGLFMSGRLTRIELGAAGPGQVICDAEPPRGGTWGPGGEIVFAVGAGAGLSIVPAAGGAPRALTTLDPTRHEIAHLFPTFLPGGKAVLFLVKTAAEGASTEQSTIDAVEIPSGRRKQIVAAGSSPRFSDGWLLFGRADTLLAQRFDPARLELSGDPITVANGVASWQQKSLVSVSNEGTLLYREGTGSGAWQLSWLDRQGRSAGTIQDPALRPEMSLAHDGTRLAYVSQAAGESTRDVWIRDLDRGTASRLTFDEGSETAPVWSPDDRFVYYQNDRRSGGSIWRKRADGTGDAEEVGTAAGGLSPLSASADGRWLLASTARPTTRLDLVRLDLPTHQVTPLIATADFEFQGRLSPDDRFVAYQFDQSGIPHVYVAALGGERGRWQISTDEGDAPRWSADGRELFFLSPEPWRLMSVAVELGTVPRFSTPREIFRFPAWDYAPSRDGKRFLVASRGRSASEALTLVSHWSAGVVR